MGVTIDGLSERVRGEVITPDDAGYEERGRFTTR